MISFDLKCTNHHVFEVWFRSSADYEAQSTAHQIMCPNCGDTEISKAVMAPAIASKSNKRPTRTEAPESEQSVPMTIGAPGQAEQVQALIQALAHAQANALSESQWVGEKFADRARAMHYGEAEHSIIHGTASAQQAREMIEEGLPVAPLLVPITPPDQVN